MSASRTRMPKFRLKMDLSQFFEDERRLGYILVDPKWEVVCRLEEHVASLFNVSTVYFLTDDGVYIPSQESIDIIKPSDTLKVVVPHKSKRKRKKEQDLEQTGVNGDTVTINEFNVEEEGSKNRLDVDDRLTSSTPNVRLRKVQKTSLEATISSAAVTGDGVSSTNYSSTGYETEVPRLEESELNEETAKTHKRKRIRKKPRIDSSVSRLSQVPVPISSSTFRQSQSMANQHLYFTDRQSSEERVIFRCRLANCDGIKPREIEAEPPPKPRIEVQEDIVLVKAAPAAVNNSSVIEVEDSFTAEDAIENASLSYEEIQDLTCPMSGFPDIGDKFMFRMIKPNGSRPPEVSEYLCARCEDVNATKMTVTCLLLGGSENFDGIRPGSGDETAPNQNRVELRLDELIDKRCFRT